ncbi:MAG TPA: hypothetical protein VKN99_16830 [Polyangia bacterium]|nr:hypothetical protein [Polyangia bacterium]
MGLKDFFKKTVDQVKEQVNPQTPAARPPAAAHAEDEDDRAVASAVDEDATDDQDTDPDDFGGWDPHNHEEFWFRVFMIEDAGNKGDAELAQTLRKYGLRDKGHFDRIRETFQRHFGANTAFTQAAMNARMRQTKESMKAAAAGKPGLMDPIEGVSVQLWATIAARRSRITGPNPTAEVAKLLAEYNLDEARYQRADAGWQARMRSADDPMAAAAIASEYGAAFSAAASGQFAGGAKAAAPGIAVGGAVGQAPAGGEPCSFERWCEIGAAQAAWSDAGRDVNAMLKQTFNMSAVDWSNVSAYWSQRIQADYTLALKIDEIQKRYKPRYAAPAQDDDLKL